MITCACGYPAPSPAFYALHRIWAHHDRPRDVELPEPSITCPRCGRTSYNANDIREGYCGACHDWTAPR